MSSIYDSLGFLALVVLLARNTFQELCRLKLSWDDIIPDPVIQKCLEWIEDLQLLTDFRVDQCFMLTNFGKALHTQLYQFCDAGEEGYGSIPYLVQQSSKGHVHSAFVMGKASTAPLKPTTIPHLELTWATMAVHVDTLMRKELDLQLTHSIFDRQQDCLKYINNKTTRFRTFVANSVGNSKGVNRISMETCKLTLESS